MYVSAVLEHALCQYFGSTLTRCVALRHGGLARHGPSANMRMSTRQQDGRTDAATEHSDRPSPQGTICLTYLADPSAIFIRCTSFFRHLSGSVLMDQCQPASKPGIFPAGELLGNICLLVVAAQACWAWMGQSMA